ncbi:MAG TPA: hypothetical protein VGF97_00145 [Rhizomicrobium sp.]
MANQYEAHLTTGEKYNVTTDDHHDDHTDDRFKNLLLGIIQSSAGGVISGTVMHFVFKGRK